MRPGLHSPRLQNLAGAAQSGGLFRFRRRQEPDNAAEAFPGRLIQRGLGADQVADHLPGNHVKGAFRGHSHGKRDGALGAEADAVGGGLLAWPHAYGLGEHIDGDGLVSGLNLAAAAQTVNLLHEWPFLIELVPTIS